MADRIIKGEHRTDPYHVLLSLSGESVGTWQEEYPLREAEFVYLKTGKPKIFLWAEGILLATCGFAISLIAKGYSNISDIQKGDWVALVAGILIPIILYGIGRFLPNERKTVMKKIEEHFKQAPTSRLAFPRIKK